jgi:hypothetical protein
MIHTMIPYYKPIVADFQIQFLYVEPNLAHLLPIVEYILAAPQI